MFKIYAQKVPKVLEQFMFRGFEVTIINNRRWSFKYEWIIKPVKFKRKKKFIASTKPKLRRICENEIKTGCVFDPTSHKFRYMAKCMAKTAIGDCYENRKNSNIMGY